MVGVFKPVKTFNKRLACDTCCDTFEKPHQKTVCQNLSKVPVAFGDIPRPRDIASFPGAFSNPSLDCRQSAYASALSSVSWD